MSAARAEVGLVELPQLRHGEALHHLRRGEHAAVRLVRVEHCTELLQREWLRLRQRHGELAQVVVLYPRELGLRERGIAYEIGHESRHLRRELGQHGAADARLLYADRDVERAAHGCRLASELLGAPRRGALLHEIAHHVCERHLVRGFVRITRTHHQLHIHLRECAILHQRHRHPVGERELPLLRKLERDRRPRRRRGLLLRRRRQSGCEYERRRQENQARHGAGSFRGRHHDPLLSFEREVAVESAGLAAAPGSTRSTVRLVGRRYS